MTRDLAVLIPAWKDNRELPRTLSSLGRAAEKIEGIEIVIAAGGGPGQFEQALALAAEFTAGACRVIPQRPLGKMRALRDAMELVSSRHRGFLLMLDADTRVDPTGLVRAMSFVEEQSDLAGVGGIIRNGTAGIGAAHDVVNLAWQTGRRGLWAVSGGAILLRGSVVWPHWEVIFADHDYPVHIDYQICERIAKLTGFSFAICPAFTLETPRARGLAFLRAERRHHRAMFARAPLSVYRRYLAGAAVTAALPLAVPAAFVPPFWPLTLPIACLSTRRLMDLKKRYDVARAADREVEAVSFPAFVLDEWVFSLSALLGAADRLRGRVDGPSFRGFRDRMTK